MTRSTSAWDFRTQSPRRRRVDVFVIDIRNSKPARFARIGREGLWWGNTDRVRHSLTYEICGQWRMINLTAY